MLTFGRLRTALRHTLLALPLPLLALSPVALGPARAATTAKTQLPGPLGTRRNGTGTPGIVLPRVAQRLLHQSPLRIVAFGSSSTQGIGASSHARSYPSQLEEAMEALLPHEEITVLNRGIGGEDSEDLTKRIEQVIADAPDVVIFQTGTNDPLRGVSVDRFSELTRQDVARLQTAGIDVMLMEPQLCHVTRTLPTAVLYRDAVRQIGAEMGAPVIRRWDLMQAWLDHDLLDAAQMLAPDGLHMADAGYAMLAREVARELVAASNSRAAPAKLGTRQAGVGQAGVGQAGVGQAASGN